MKYLALVLFALACGSAIAPARADDPPAAAPYPATSVDLSTTTYGFSPGDVYGPWRFTTLVVRGVAGKDKPGLTVTTRSDRDGAFTSNGTEFLVDDYHDWTPRFFTYAALGTASGSVLPTRSAFAEGDWNVHNGLVVGVGGGVYDNPDGLVQRYLTVGPTLYFPHGNALVRYQPIFTQGQPNSASWIANLSLGDAGIAGRTVTSLTLQSGVEPEFVLNDPQIANRFQNRSFVADLLARHFVRANFGYEVGVDFAHQTDRTTGNTVYTRRGLTLGLFTGIGRSPTSPY